MKRPVIDIELLRKTHNETKKSLQLIAQQAPVKEGQLYIHGWFKSYTSWVETNGKKNKLETAQIPERKMIAKRDGTGSFPGSLILNVQLKELTEIADNCVPDGEGGWKVKMHITYTPEAEAFLTANYDAYYKQQLPDLKFPVGDFVSEDGQFKNTYWRRFNKNDLIEITCYDNDDGIFRGTNDDGTPKVDPYTEIRFGNCLAVSKIIMLGDYAQKDPLLRQKVPGESVSFNCKGQSTLSANNDPNFTGTERIHNLNDLDAHTLIPFAELVKGKPLPNETSFEYLADEYTTPASAEKDYAVVTFVDYTPEEHLKREYMKKVSYQDKVQWSKYQTTSGTREEDREKYFFCTATARDNEWKQWGILNPDAYVSIRSANRLPLMLQVNWIIKDIMMDENNVKILNMKPTDPDPQNLRKILGIYRGYIREYNVDFIRGLPNFKLGGIKISKERVEQEFSKWKGIRHYDNTTMLNLAATIKEPNPLHARGLNSPIISLGNGKCDPNSKQVPVPLYHGFTGDIFPILAQSDFYVLVSRQLTDEERKLHAGDTGIDGDAFLDNLIKTIPDLQYWIYAYNKPCIPKRSVTVVTEEGTKKAKVEDDNMDVEEDEEEE